MKHRLALAYIIHVMFVMQPGYVALRVTSL